MENAADAFKMAAAVLIFVVALSISINAFGEARITSRMILDYKDREYDYTYVDDNGGTTERIVGLDSIIPSIYKAYKENYKIVFASPITGFDANEGIYQKVNAGASPTPVWKIDLQNEVLGTNTQKEQFIMAILYGDGYSDFTTVKNEFENDLGIILNSEGIYDKINNRRASIGIGLKESLGIYYQEEAPGESGVAPDPDSVPDANKTTKRVITYSEP